MDGRFAALFLAPIFGLGLRVLVLRLARLADRRIAPMPAVVLAAVAVAGSALLGGSDATTIWIDCALGWALLALAWIDGLSLRLPDVLSLPLLLAGLAATFVQEPAQLGAHALAAVAGYTAFVGFAAAYRRLRGHAGLGAGDAKLLAAGGAWLGLEALPWVVLLASVLGLAIALVRQLRGEAIGRHSAMPFGPGLAAAIWLLHLAG